LGFVGSLSKLEKKIIKKENQIIVLSSKIGIGDLIRISTFKAFFIYLRGVLSLRLVKLLEAITD
jgi:hypothetical protein